MDMNPIERLEQTIRNELPNSWTRLDPAATPSGEWWLDARLGSHTVTIQWSKLRGFGVSASAFGDGYGEKPEETLREGDVGERVLHLLRTGEPTRPPYEVALRELRVHTGLTQEELASRLGVQQAAISRLESRSDLTLSTLRRFVAALGGKLEINVRTATGEQLPLERLAQPKLAGSSTAMWKVDDVETASKSSLTSREGDVLRLMAQGKNNRDVAQELFISEKTVKNHIRNILEKLHLHSRMEAIEYARSGVANRKGRALLQSKDES